MTRTGLHATWHFSHREPASEEGLCPYPLYTGAGLGLPTYNTAYAVWARKY